MTKKLTKEDGRRAAHMLNNAGKWKTEGGREEASAAARALGLRRASKRGGRKSLQAAGKLGAAAFWGRMTFEERRIEARRRAAVRKKNRRARMEQLLEKGSVAERAQAIFDKKA